MHGKYYILYTIRIKLKHHLSIFFSPFHFDWQLHLVHWNTGRFKSINEAISEEGGIAVLGVFLKVSYKFSFQMW